jgi:hypothetical protein
VIVLASVVPAGCYQRRAAGWLLLSGAIAAILASTILPQLPRSLEARGDYGVQWSSLSRPKTTRMRGRAGFNMLPSNGIVSLDVTPVYAGPWTSEVEVRLNGKLLRETNVRGGRKRLKYEWPRMEMVFVELTVTNRKTGKPDELILRLGR